MSDAIVSKLLRFLPARSASADLPTLSQCRRILLIKPDEIGDVVLASPTLRELRHNAPNAHITLVVKQTTFNLVQRCPYVDEILVAPLRRTFGGRSEMAQLVDGVRFAKANLWDRFDLAILLRCGSDENGERNLTFFSGARWRIGFCTKHDRRLTDCISPAGVMHESQRMLQCVSHLGGVVRSTKLETWTDEQDATIARSLPAATYVALCVGAGAPKRQWPVERYAEVLRTLFETSDARAVIVGGAADRTGAAQFAQQFPEKVIDLTGRMTLRETIEVLKRCAVYLGNDTGPMHLAAAVGCPVVAVSCHPRGGSPSHASAPERFGPWGVPSHVVQPNRALPPCNDGCDANEPHCITLVTVDEVLEAIQSLMLDTIGRK